jgi:alkaline phosphatase
VSTVPFNHATPAAFLAHSKARADYAAIAGEIILGTRPELVIGGGHPGWNTDYAGAYAKGLLESESGYLFVEKKAGANGEASLFEGLDRLGPGIDLFGYFGGADGSLEAPLRQHSPGAATFTRGIEDPSLAAAVTIAARSLARNPRGFLLVVEQGDIDWANHANDYPRMLGAMYSLDEAVRAIESFIDLPGDAIDWDNSLVIVTADHATGLLRFTDSSVIGTGSLPSSYEGGVYQYPGGTVSYNTTGHANELVTVSARGAEAEATFVGLPGARWPGTSIIDNTDIHRAISRFLGFE